MVPFFHLSTVAAAALIAAIWQSTLLALAVALMLRLVPDISPTTRSQIWAAVFALSILLHLAPAFAPPAASAAPSPALHVNPIWSIMILAAWAALALARAIQLAVGALTLHRICANAEPIAPPDACAALIAASPRHVRLCASCEIDRPSVAGFFRPRILIPAGLLASITASELAQVLLHELEHIRRRDDWTNLLQKLALVLFPLNPALLFIERRLCAERELACDDRVLAATGAPKAYATCLTHLAERTLLRRTLALALGAWRAPSELTRRVTRILTTPTLSRRTNPAFLITALLALTAASVELTHAPQLVSFAPTARSTPSAISYELSADRSSPTPAPHLTLTRATVLPHPHSPRPVHVLRRPLPSPQRPRMTLTSFNPNPHPTNSQPSARIIYAVATTTRQISYAAVAVPGGWIIIPIQQTTLTLDL